MDYFNDLKKSKKLTPKCVENIQKCFLSDEELAEFYNEFCFVSRIFQNLENMDESENFAPFLLAVIARLAKFFRDNRELIFNLSDAFESEDMTDEELKECELQASKKFKDLSKLTDNI